MNTPQVTTYTRYEVSVEGESAIYGPDSYSKYYDRLRRADAGEFDRSEVYGYEQAAEHANEIRNYVYDDTMYNLEKKIVIHIKTVVIAALPIDPITDPVAAYLNDFMRRDADKWMLPRVWVSKAKSLTTGQKEQLEQRIATNIPHEYNKLFMYAEMFFQTEELDPLEWWKAKVKSDLPITATNIRRKFLAVVSNTKDQLEYLARLEKIKS